METKVIKPNIIYLIGAGASAQNQNVQTSGSYKPWIPVANNFPEAIIALNIQSRLVSKLKEIGLKDEANNLVAELMNFGEFIRNHRSIDEAMRILELNSNIPKFEEYKKAISLFFYLLETIDNYRDTRYSQFLLTLIDKKFKFRSNLFFLSWNYDNQFELAANALINGGINELSLNNKNYHKINGTAYLTKYGNSTLFDLKNITSMPSEILFAWEFDEENPNETMNLKLNDFLNQDALTSNGKNILVAIGYSFPTVNHYYDLTIIKKLKIKKIYFQNKDSRIEEMCTNLKNRFKGVFRDIEFISITDTDRFYIPYEYYESSIQKDINHLV